jgi:hypothetical protein
MKGFVAQFRSALMLDKTASHGTVSHMACQLEAGPSLRRRAADISQRGAVRASVQPDFAAGM